MIVAILAVPPAASAQTTDTIINSDSGNCLDVWHSGTADYTNVDAFSCNDTNAQQWVFYGAWWLGSNWYYIQNPHSGKCLDVYHSGTTPGANVDIYSCNETAAQEWYIPNFSNGQIMSRLTVSSASLCLEDHGGNAIIDYCYNDGPEQWSSGSIA